MRSWINRSLFPCHIVTGPRYHQTLVNHSPCWCKLCRRNTAWLKGKEHTKMSQPKPIVIEWWQIRAVGLQRMIFASSWIAGKKIVKRFPRQRSDHIKCDPMLWSDCCAGMPLLSIKNIVFKIYLTFHVVRSAANTRHHIRCPPGWRGTKEESLKNEKQRHWQGYNRKNMNSGMLPKWRHAIVGMHPIRA